MSPECVCAVLAQNTPQIIFYSMIKWWGKTCHFVCVPLHANELLPPAQRAEFQLLMC